MNRTIVFFAIVFLLAFSFGCTSLLNQDATTQAPLSYEPYSTDYFSISYPSNWNVETISGEDDLPSVEFNSRREGLNDYIIDQLIVEVFYVGEGFSTFEDFEYSENLLLYETDEVTSTKTTTFQGNNALEIKGHGPVEDVDVSFTTIYFVKGDHVYRIQYAIESDKEGKYLPIVEHMLETFRVA